MTIRNNRILWFFVIYSFSLAGFAVFALLMRTLLRWIV
jgi:Protein of unknown function (DUF2474)